MMNEPRIHRTAAAAALAAAALSWSTAAWAGPRFGTDLDAGVNHSCAVTSCGEVKCWGRNDWGQSNDRSPSPPIYIIGTYQAPFLEASVGQYHTCALDEDGEVLCWGAANYGQTASPTGPFTHLDAGYNHNCAIRSSNGSLACWGANDTGQSTPPSGSWRDVSAGRQHSCAVKSDRTEVRCWGSNSYGQGRTVLSTDLVTGELFAEVSAGDYHTCARTTSSRVYCWGYDYYGAVSGGGQAFDQGGGIFRHPQSAWRQVSAGGHGSAGIFQDGPTAADNEVWAWGWPFSSAGPFTPPSIAPSQVAAGYNHACLIDNDGEVTCWGSNQYGKATHDVTGSCPGSPFPLPPPFGL